MGGPEVGGTRLAAQPLFEREAFPGRALLGVTQQLVAGVGAEERV